MQITTQKAKEGRRCDRKTGRQEERECGGWGIKYKELYPFSGGGLEFFVMVRLEPRLQNLQVSKVSSQQRLCETSTANGSKCPYKWDNKPYENK